MSNPLGWLMALLLGLFASCGIGSGSVEEQAGHAVGTLVTSWSEAGPDGDLVPKDVASPEGALITSGSARDVWLAGLPDELDVNKVRAVDLDHNVLVVAGFGSCAEQGRVMAYDLDPSIMWFDVHLPPGEEGVECVWAPYQLQVWQVPLADIGGVTPDKLNPPLPTPTD